jgi:hypothetical protein
MSWHISRSDQTIAKNRPDQTRRYVERLKVIWGSVGGLVVHLGCLTGGCLAPRLTRAPTGIVI